MTIVSAVTPEDIVSGSPRSSHIPNSADSLPTWGPPKAPLPPYRLAKLANALGVSTPVPAVHLAAPFMPRSRSLSPGTSDPSPRSPTPSTPASHFAYSHFASRYLLHVIPPLYLPHEIDEDSDLTPPPSTASGYHTQFHRGTLVPLYPSFQSQLSAIAKEYALPSTTGLILYLVSSAKTLQPRDSSSDAGFDKLDEPGPRLSEDIWRHLWTRVITTEQRDDNIVQCPGRSPTPNMYGPIIGSQITPSLSQDSNGQPLRPFISIVDASQPRPITPIPPSPSTPSSVSNPKYAPLSSPSLSRSEPGTPDTSSASHSFLIEAQTRANSLVLPGLDSPSVIPILAKVEFDIDRRRAPWYDPWLRSRKMNHAKRTESRTGRAASVNEGGAPLDGGQEKHVHIGLLTGRVQTSSPVPFVFSPAGEKAPLDNPSELIPCSEQEQEPAVAGYEQLVEPEDGEFSDSDEEPSDEITARVILSEGKDPLVDVFGTDADTWAEMRGPLRRHSKREADPNIVELALSGADLAALPSPTESEFEYLGKEMNEVQALLDRMSNSHSSTTIRPSAPGKRSSSSSGSKKEFPSSLMFGPGSWNGRDAVVEVELGPISESAGAVSNTYLSNGLDEVSLGDEKLSQIHNGDEFEMDYPSIRIPAKLEKREGAVYDDVDLGLDPTEDFDENDPHDRRRSQYLMKAQLDEIERTMAQLSPRVLQFELEEEQPSLSPNNSVSLSPRQLNDIYPRNSHQYTDTDRGSPVNQAAWQATPFVPLGNRDTALSNLSPWGPLSPPSPPRLAVNGVTTSAPNAFVPNPGSSNKVFPDTEHQKRELDEEYSGLTSSPDLPIIPLDPDPFGRYSPLPDPSYGSHPSVAYWDKPPATFNAMAERPGPTENVEDSDSRVTSRFSADSPTLDDRNQKVRPTSSAVSSFKKLWKRGAGSKAPSLSNAQSSLTSTTPMAEGRSQELNEGPRKTPTLGRFSPQLILPRHSQEQVSNSQPQQQLVVPHQHLPMSQPQQPPNPLNSRSPSPQSIVDAQRRSSRNTSISNLFFDQETPYPVHRHPSYPSRPPPALATVSPQTVQPSSSVVKSSEKPSIRKSILKGWKSSSSTGSISLMTGTIPQQHPAPMQEPRANLDRSNAPLHGRRPSVLNFGSTRTSTTLPPNIPPSPDIPQQFMNESRHSLKSRFKFSPTNGSLQQSQQMDTAPTAESGSPRRSMASSRSWDSRESRPSFDASQFEIVSPKINSTLSYPYHELDDES